MFRIIIACSCITCNNGNSEKLLSPNKSKKTLKIKRLLFANLHNRLLKLRHTKQPEYNVTGRGDIKFFRAKNDVYWSFSFFVGRRKVNTMTGVRLLDLLPNVTSLRTIAGYNNLQNWYKQRISPHIKRSRFPYSFFRVKKTHRVNLTTLKNKKK